MESGEEWRGACGGDGDERLKSAREKRRAFSFAVASVEECCTGCYYHTYTLHNLAYERQCGGDI